MNFTFLVLVLDMSQNSFVTDSICKIFLPLPNNHTPILFVEGNVRDDLDFFTSH